MRMNKGFLKFIRVSIIILVFFQPVSIPVHASTSFNPSNILSPVNADAYSLIAEVNNLRAANGLPAYNIHPILMQIAQAQSEYLASTGTCTHIGPGGSSPFERALVAGYPVAGQLPPGFFSENYICGNYSPKEAVAAWQGDAPHLNTMLSPNLSDVGAGVAIVGNYVYYTLDAGLASGSPVSYTPSARETPGVPAVTYVAPVSINPPLEDGSIIHIVQPGETLWTIAAAYGVKIDVLRLQNNLKAETFIYPGDKLTIRPAVTATTEPLTPTSTPKPPPTNTLSPTDIATSTQHPTPIRAAAANNITTTLIVLGIVVLALGIAGALTWVSGKRDPR